MDIQDGQDEGSGGVPYLAVQSKGDGGLDSRLRGNDGWARE